MAGNQIQIYTVKCNESESIENYESTLFSEDEADPTPCTERAVVYNCLVVAGLIADIVAQISKGMTPPRSLEVDLTNFAMYGGNI